jgi:purine-nucleoside/S-methyl-5'-thioadenosine phosphorylase / adenosine deaminase
VSPARKNHSRANKKSSPLGQLAGETNVPLEVLRAEALEQLPWLFHGFSTRPGGVSTCYGGKTLNVGFTQHDSKGNVARNRALFLEAAGAQSKDARIWPLVQMKQLHSSVVHRVSAAPREPLAGDGLITNTPGLLLAVKTADCVPVLVADVERRAVGAFHAGWRGTVARVVEKGLGEMRRQFGSLPSDLHAIIGPSIRRCCYQVGPEVRAQFESQFSYADELFEEVFDGNALHLRYPLLFLNQRAPGHGELGPETHLDLLKANKRQLLDAGVREQNISVLEGCTACDTARFFSHRAEFGQTGRMMAVIGFRQK